ncbi:hypothetical protein MMC17_004650 [Xylographa soralifera]|nr:hypothetical protein [Xylographa soralifera]
MLAISTTIFASPLAQLTTDPLGTFIQSTLSSAPQNAQANPGSSQISVCNNGVCTHNPSALNAPATGPPAPAGNNAAPGANGGTSPITVANGNGQTVQGANQATPPLQGGMPGTKPRKDPKNPSPKTKSLKKTPQHHRRRYLLPSLPNPLALAASAKAQSAAIDRAIAPQDPAAASNPNPSSSTATTTNDQAAPPPAPAPQDSTPDSGASTPSTPSTPSDATQKKHPKHPSPGTHHNPAPKLPTAHHHAPKPLRRRFLDGATSAAQALAIADGLAGDSPAPAPAPAPMSGGWPSADSSTVVDTDGQSAQGPAQGLSPAGSGGGVGAGKGRKKKGGKGGKGKGKGKGGVAVPKAKVKAGKMPVRVRRAVGEWVSKGGI